MQKSFGEQIKEARVRKKLKQDDLGALMHVTRSSVSHWETGHTIPEDDTLRRLEEILECKFEIEQEQEKDSEEHTTHASASHDNPAAAKRNNVFRAVLNKKVPLWACVAVACGIFTVMLTIMLCTTTNFQKQIDALNKQPARPYSLAWYQQNDAPEEGCAYVTITTDQNPVKGVCDPGGTEAIVWIYTISMVEHSGIDFTVTEVFFQDFNGDVPRGSERCQTETIIDAWGNNVIPAHGMQYWGAGMPVQAVSHRGVSIKGVDANGNELEFHGIINFSQEIAE